MGIFGADVDVALAGADRDGRDGHALDHHEGIALHDHAVGESAAVAFVGVADDVFAVGAGLRHGLPLDAGREAGAAAAAQAGGGDFGQDAVGTELQCPLKAFVAVVGAVILDRARIDHAAAGEGQPRLPLEPRDIFGDAEPQGVRGRPRPWRRARQPRRPRSAGRRRRAPAGLRPRPSAPASTGRASRS